MGYLFMRRLFPMNKLTKTLSVLSGCGALMLAVSAAHADKVTELVANGGFETGDFTGWTLTGNSAYSQVSNVDWGYLHANSGSNYAMLGSFGGLSYLSQNLATLPGASYTLSYDLASDGYTGNEFSASVGGATLFDQTDIPEMDYTLYTFHFTATGDSTTLSLGSRDDQGYLLLDDVSVMGPPSLSVIPDGGDRISTADTPLPASLWLGGLPMLAMAASRVRRRWVMA